MLIYVNIKNDYNGLVYIVVGAGFCDGFGPGLASVVWSGRYSPSPLTANPLGPSPVDEDVPAILAR